jgi:hypothetical protein
MSGFTSSAKPDRRCRDPCDKHNRPDYRPKQADVSNGKSDAVFLRWRLYRNIYHVGVRHHSDREINCTAPA